MIFFKKKKIFYIYHHIIAGTKGDCTVLRPSLMCAVPLVIDRIYKGIQEKVSKRGTILLILLLISFLCEIEFVKNYHYIFLGPFMKRLLEFCYRYKSYYKKRGMDTPILNALIFKNMRAIVGGRIRLLLSGGAPLSPDTHDYVRNALCLPLVQGYGLTESCACGTIMDRYVFVYYYFLFYFYVKLIFFFFFYQ